MKFIYGKNDFKTLERGEENCWLLTNGLGGFSSCTGVNSVTRNDHALLMASLKAPNVRWNLVHRVSEKLVVEEEKSKTGTVSEQSVENGTEAETKPEKTSIWLSTQSFEGKEPEDGYRNLNRFSFEDYPEWQFQAAGTEVIKSVVMQPGENTVAVRYEIHNRSRRNCCLEITPRYQFVPKGQDLEKGQKFSVKPVTEKETMGTVSSEHVELYYRINAEEKELPPVYEICSYPYDRCDGRR